MSQSPRIAYLCADCGIPVDGNKGAAVHFRQMASALTARGAQLDVVAVRGAACAALPAARVAAASRGSGWAGELAQLATNATVAAALDAGEIHDAVYERFSLFGVAGLAHARHRGIPLLLEVNAPLWEEATRFRSLQLEATARGMARDVLCGADQVFAVSDALADGLRGLGVQRASLEVLSNGVERELFERVTPAAVPAVFTGRPVLAFVGSLKPWHGIEFLLRAVELLGADLPLGLWIVGDGPERALVEAARARRPYDVVWEGAVKHERVAAVLRAADVAVAPYPTDAPDYFCPLKVVEAVAAGCPLVASRKRCVTDVLPPQARTELFTPGDVGDFGRAVARALALGRGRGAPQVPQGFGWQEKAGRVLEVVAALRQRGVAKQPEAAR